MTDLPADLIAYSYIRFSTPEQAQGDSLRRQTETARVRAPRGQWVQATFGAPGQVATQVGPGVLTGGPLEPGQVGGHCQPQLVSERLRRMGWR